MPELNTRATEYIGSLPSPQREICQALREAILETFPEMSEEFKWGYPAYYYNRKRICITGGFKQHANIELFYGSRLKDNKGKIEGAGKNTRHIKLKSLEEVDIPYLLDLIQQSIELARTGSLTNTASSENRGAGVSLPGMSEAGAGVPKYP